MHKKIDLTRPIIPDLSPASHQKRPKGPLGADFQRVLEQAIATRTNLQFSKHALERLKNRNLEMTTERLARVEQGVEQAAQKGCRESLVLLDEMALIVSITNQTVVTALDGQSLKNNLFTNIDSAIIV